MKLLIALYMAVQHMPGIKTIDKKLPGKDARADIKAMADRARYDREAIAAYATYRFNR
jgi:hypothetical protein